MSDPKLDAYLTNWREKTRLVEEMVPVVGRLYRDRGVIITVFGHSLVNRPPNKIHQIFRMTDEVVESGVSHRDCYDILTVVDRLDLAPARIDIGNLFTRLRAEQGETTAYSSTMVVLYRSAIW